jgi:F-type H+-transporting ATPase subunit b
MAEGEEGFWATAYPILPHPVELFFGLFTFALLYFVVSKYVVPRLEQIYTERTAAIEGGMEKAEKAQAEAEEARQHYVAQLAESREDAGRIREEAKEQGAQIVAEAREQAQAEADRIKESGKRQIEAERQQAMTQLRGEVGRLSTDLAGRIVGESLEDPARQSGVVERFIAELESGSAQRRQVPAGQES